LGELGIKYIRVLVIFSLRSSLISSIDCCDEQSCEFSSLSLSSNPRDSFDRIWNGEEEKQKIIILGKLDHYITILKKSKIKERPLLNTERLESFRLKSFSCIHTSQLKNAYCYIDL
jgi:hypothetical protein